MGHHVSALGRFALAGLFVTVPRMAVSPRIHGLEYDLRAPRTFYAITHKRDFDAFVPVPLLLAHRGRRAFTGDVHFGMRADAFHVGFLARVVRRPVWFSRALRPLSVGWVLRGVGVHPLDSLHLRPAESWIQETLQAEDACTIGELLAPEMIQTLAQQSGETPAVLMARPASALRSWRYFLSLQFSSGPEIFAPAVERRAELRVLATAKEQLAEFVDWLREGGSLYSSPEGLLSPNGLLSPARAGLTRILRAAPPDSRIQPIAIVYDFMSPGRMRMWIDLAPAIVDGSSLTHAQLEQRLRAAWLLAARFTCTQLASGVLVSRQQQGQRAITIDDLEASIAAWARELADAGRHLDPALLTATGVHRRVEGFVKHAVHHGIVRRYDDCIALAPGQPTPITVAVGDVGYHTAPLLYAANEMREMASLTPTRYNTLAV